jgi:hypothetical protein
VTWLTRLLVRLGGDIRPPSVVTPIFGGRVIRPIAVFETEMVEIKWSLKDGSIFYHRITVPPKSVREAHRFNNDIDEMRDPS